MDGIKIFAKNIKNWETLLQTKGIYNQHIDIEFDIEKFTFLIRKSEFRKAIKETELSN